MAAIISLTDERATTRAAQIQLVPEHRRECPSLINAFVWVYVDAI